MSAENRSYAGKSVGVLITAESETGTATIQNIIDSGPENTESRNRRRKKNEY